ncbi:MAG: cation:proton antiporter, partial [Phycisphaerales bacterium]|nr:cation:proton antiporter [Phycisphaerales bacterium]
MHGIDLILTLAGGFTAAVVLGYVTHRLGLSPIVGYLIAGLLVGPHTPGFVADQRMAEQLAEVGVILLMFGVGLHFHLKDLLAVRKVAILGAILQSAIATGTGALAARAFGWSWPAGLVFGLALSVASTVVLIRVLSDHRDLQSSAGRIAIGWLVVEDIFTVFVLVVLPALFGSGTQQGLSATLGWTALRLLLFIGFTLLGGGRAIPWLLARVSNTHSRELFVLGVLAIALGIAAGAAQFLGVSMALGAFLAGMVVGQSEFSARASSEAMPMRDAFAVMFFLSVGMLLDPSALRESAPIAGAALAIIMIGKPLAAYGIVMALGHGTHTASKVAMALAQIGEFSFMLAVVGRELQVLPAIAMNALIAASIVSISVNPLLYRWVASFHESKNEPVPGPLAHRAVVIGYGPVGQAVAGLMRERGIEPVIVERNAATAAHLREEGHPVIQGDAGNEEVLRQAGLEEAVSLILSAPVDGESAELIRVARRINPEVFVLARSTYLSQAVALRAAGADEIFSGEGEVAVSMTSSVLQHLGATPEQLDQERERIRKSLIEG